MINKVSTCQVASESERRDEETDGRALAEGSRKGGLTETKRWNADVGQRRGCGIYERDWSP